MKIKLIKFRQVRVVSKPIKVKFYTKENEPIWFKAIKGIEKPKKVKFYVNTKGFKK